MTRNVTRFILVDDDPIHIKLCTFQIGTLDETIVISSFLQVSKALDYLRTIYNEPVTMKGVCIIMVNVNMAGLSGWDFLDEYEKLHKECNDQVELYFVSASIDPNDRKRARSSPHVKDYLVKPLNKSDFQNLVGKPESNEP